MFSWGGNPGVGSLHRLRDAVEHGWPEPLELEEHSHAGMAAAYAAGAANLPFGVLRGYAGTDLPGAHARRRWIECPFTGERLAAVRALRPDVGIIHAQRADRKGNVQLWGISGVQKEAVLAAARSLVTVEEIVDELEPVPGAVILPGLGGDAPWRSRRGGAHPSYAHGYYERDNALLPPLGRDQPRPRRVRATGSASTCWRPPDERLHRRGDDGRRRRPPAARRRRLLRRHRPAQPAANLARATHAPGCVLIYESGTIGAKPLNLPLSIGDGELAETADAVVSVPEIFSYWLQGGRIDVGFLGAAQIDRYANLNSTVIGDYDHPKVRLPGGGGAPEIAASCKETLVILKQSPRTFVERSTSARRSASATAPARASGSA